MEAAARGLTAAETGREMHLATDTVKGIRKRAIAKLGARNVTNAVVVALRRGIIALPPDLH